jgi:RNA polymerase sigma factor (sigma-70 family)
VAGLSDSEVEALYRKYAPLVHARARRLVGDEADDVVHEVFIRFLRAARSTPESSSWFYVTTTNVCLDRLRHRARRDERWLAEVGRAAEGARDLETLLEAQDTCRRVLAVVDDKTAAVAAMVYVDGMSQDDVAAAFGVTRTAIAKRLARFLRDARAKLGFPFPAAERLKR